MISFFRRHRNQKGFSLVEVMVATGMMTIAGVSMLGLSQIASQDSLQLRATRVILTARTQIEASLKNPAAWNQTVAQNTSFTCAGVAPGCALNTANAGYYDFVLYGVSSGEKVTFDSTDATTRYSIQGGNCPAGTASPDALCPIKFVARWKPLCQTYPCLTPTLDIKVSLVLEFGPNAPVINAEKFEYATIRELNDSSMQSACQVLNGVYNSSTGTCYPKNAGRTCALQGAPAQIVTSVAVDGTITCAPLYAGACDPATQVMSGIDATGTAQCAPKVIPGTCPVNCIGAWGACSAACGGGTQTYGVTTPAANGGAACTSPAPGATQACNVNPCPVNCVGGWGACTVPCGGGTMTYSVTVPEANGGAACTNLNGDTQPCNTQACAVPVDCAGSWSACDQLTGTQTYTVTQAPQNGGLACPNPLTVSCPVDCVGAWGACGGGPPQFRTFSWSTTPLNGGAACAYPNGQTDTLACNICPTIGNYVFNSVNQCWDFTQTAMGMFCLGDRSPDCTSFTCLGVTIVNDTRNAPVVFIRQSLTAGQSVKRELRYYSTGTYGGPGTCRTSMYDVVCNANGTTTVTPDNTVIPSGGCGGCAANTYNDCF